MKSIEKAIMFLTMIPTTGIVLGLIVGLIFCLFITARFKKGKWIWISFPLFPYVGCLLAVFIFFSTSRKISVESSYGTFTLTGHGMLLGKIPDSFQKNNLKLFYNQVQIKRIKL